MSKKDEALKMAIEALENINKLLPAVGIIMDKNWIGSKTLEACKEALAEPKSEWRGLSDEDISLKAFNDDEGDSNDLCFCGCWKRGYLNGVKAIEAKLKELNYDTKR